MDRPEGVIITISRAMLAEKGYRNWLKNFLFWMDQEDGSYYMRTSARPKHDVLYVYLCIGNKIRYRTQFVLSYEAGHFTFSDGKRIYGKAWLVLSGPVVKAPEVIHRQGFQGFRYTHKLF